MKLISLNIWAGKEFDSLMRYISDNEKDTDIFCFQEVFNTPTDVKLVSEFYRANIFSELQERLPNHDGYFAPVQDGCGFDKPVDYPISWGLAMFVKKSIKVNDAGDTYIFGHRNSRGKDNTTMPRNLQYVKVSANGEQYTIAHFHGIWDGVSKTDTEDRIEQSRKVREFLDKITGKRILCGDFNLLPTTKSLEILEEGFVNLVKTRGVTTTRSPLHKYPDKFADYTIVSSDVNVSSFEVPMIEVSDHLPMVLEYS